MRARVNGALGLVLLGVVALSLGCLYSVAAKAPALSYGKGRCGRLTGGAEVPCSGEGFEAYSAVACVLGRNYLHPLVTETVVDAYRQLAKKHPQRTWQYGDLGRKSGGPIEPHRTHQNGRATDFFFPVDNEQGEPALIPIHPFNKMGYGHDFDRHGRIDSLTIDWAALADHLLGLKSAGESRGVTIKRVILAPALQRVLFESEPSVRRLKPLFNTGPAWVLHDEHYHVVFDIPPKYKQPLRCE